MLSGLERNRQRQKRRVRLGRSGGREVRKGVAGCAIGHNDSPSLLTSMCHLTMLQIRLHMLSGDVRTYILMVCLNLQWSTLAIFF